jgi:hypothetical protein
MMLEVRDILAIHQILAMVGHIIDDEQWERLPEVLTDGFVSDATAVGFGRVEGLSAVIKSWSSPDRHADAHHGTNVVLTQVDDNTVKVISKGLSLYGMSEAHTLVHEDVLVRTGDGWRIASRLTRRRKAGVDPSSAAASAQLPRAEMVLGRHPLGSARLRSKPKMVNHPVNFQLQVKFPAGAAVVAFAVKPTLRRRAPGAPGPRHRAVEIQLDSRYPNFGLTMAVP